jgi:hypothetical protein
MKKLIKYLQIRKKKHDEDWDTLGVIVGDEGSSKSNLLLHLVEQWRKITVGKCVPEDIRFVSLTGKDFVVNNLSKCEKYGIPGFDEAGELDSRRAMSTFNVALSQAYKVIRADRLFTILVLPSFWDLESRFRLRRAKFLMHVDRRGHVKVWLKQKLRLLCYLNGDNLVKSYDLVTPDFTDTFPKYDGVLSEKYKELKAIKTTEARQNLAKIYDNENEDETENGLKVPKIPLTYKNINEIVIKKLWDVGKNNYEIAEMLSLDEKEVKRIAVNSKYEFGDN